MIHPNTSPTSVPGESAVRHVGAFISGPVARALKPFATTCQQIELLRSRGLEIDDEQSARASLSQLGYYRFSGYAHALKVARADSHPTARQFKPGATFPLVVQLAEFDKALRLLVLQGLELIEIAVRASVAEQLGKLDVEAHRNRALLDGRFTNALPGQISAHDQWLQRFGDLAFLHLDEFARKRLFGTLCCMRSMIRAITPRSAWHVQLKMLTGSFPASPALSLHSAGFPANWETLALWKD